MNNEKIYGINKTKKKFVFKKLGYNLRIREPNLLGSKLFLLNESLETKLQGRSLLEFNDDCIEFLKNNRCYRGNRHKRFLPTRGQRTRTNAKTTKKNNPNWKKDPEDEKRRSKKKKK